MEDNIIEKVNKALEKVRPYLIADGGDVEIVEIKDETVYVKFLGSCSSCPMSAMTFKAGIEEAIIKAVPEIGKVEAVSMA